MSTAQNDQLALVGAPPRARTALDTPMAAELPVATVLLDVPLAHLDRPFDYSVPAKFADDAQPGARVAARFAGADHQGFILERRATSDHAGRLTPLRRVVSSEPVLTPEIARLARAVADRYAGTVADVLRLAIPPRHARAEAAAPGPAQGASPRPEPGRWVDYGDGAALVRALTSGDGVPRAVWNPAPGPEWLDLIARLVIATVAGGRGALVVVPDGRDAGRLDAALSAQGSDFHTVLSAELGPQERYRRWLAVKRGAVSAVVGTRSAMFAPVRSLGLVAIWDDGDDLHAEPRAPYPHAREVLLLRAHYEGAAAIIGGFARTAEAQALIESGWARPLTPPRSVLKAAAPTVRVSGDDYEASRDPAARSARLPSLAWRSAREALARGPVLVQVPRAGYITALACERCRHRARCAACNGPIEINQLAQAAAGVATSARCAWCANTAWACPECGATRVRATRIGVERTAEELGRAFPGVPIRVSRGSSVLTEVGDDAGVVVATPGAEPHAADGYAAALLLDAQVLLSRNDLRAEEEALRRWFAAAALVRPASRGGEVIIVSDPSPRPVQALVRWDPGGFAHRELITRGDLRFPPTARVAELTGSAPDIAAMLEIVELPGGADVLGPVPLADEAERVRTLVRVPKRLGGALAATLKAAQGVRSAKRSGGAVRVRIDPVEIG